jgi:hypothetical protein
LIDLQHKTKKYRKQLESGKLTIEEVAKGVADKTNEDFGGLNLARLRRNPTTQHFARLLLLAPDWTESNFRTVIKTLQAGGDIESASKKERARLIEAEMHRSLWMNVAVKGMVLTQLWNFFMAAFEADEDESTVENYLKNFEKSWEYGRFRWMGVNVTPIYRALGGDHDTRKFFNLFGHFMDPMKWVTRYDKETRQRKIDFVAGPIETLKHKTSIIGGMVLEALTGTDWKDDPFTTWQELLGKDYDQGFYKQDGVYGKKGDPKYGSLQWRTTADEWKTEGEAGMLTTEQLPSFLAEQAIGVTPIQTQNLAAWLAGEMDAFDAIARSVGMMTMSMPENP